MKFAAVALFVLVVLLLVAWLRRRALRDALAEPFDVESRLEEKNPPVKNPMCEWPFQTHEERKTK